jgi:hypothetical protein
MLLDAALDLFLELDLVPVIVECDDRVDRITKFGDQEQRVDRVEYILSRRISGPVAVEDGVADSTVAIDVRMVDWRYEACLGREHRIVFFHLDIEKECSAGVRAFWRTCVLLVIASSAVYGTSDANLPSMTTFHSPKLRSQM